MQGSIEKKMSSLEGQMKREWPEQRVKHAVEGLFKQDKVGHRKDNSCLMKN